MAWTGIALRAWSILVLGGSFRRVVTVESGQRVVRDGPYAFVRHPSYTGVLLAWTGIGLATDNVLAFLALAVVPAIGYVVRIQAEEVALERGLGEEYREYARTRARLVPGVW